MKADKLAQQLVDVARRIGYKVRIEEGSFRGGWCVVKDERMIFINRRMPNEERAELLARFLAQENLDEIFLLPELRAFIENFSTPPALEETPS